MKDLLSEAKPSASTLEWLLEESNPSVRYFTLTGLVGKPADDPEVLQARDAIMTGGPAPAILANQQPGGHWKGADSFYTAKYGGTVWQLIVLAELGAKGDEPRIRKACEFILEHSQEREQGGFSQHRSARAGGGRATEVIPCLTGNMVWSLARLGYLGDPRLQRGIDWIASFQRFDDGVAEAPTGQPWHRYEICWGTHTCHMGVVKALKALGAVPEELRSPQVQATIDRGVEYMLAHRVHKRSHNLARVSKPGWLRLCFPQMYQTDILEILGILTRLGCADERMQDALEAVSAKRDAEGRWALDASFNDRMPVAIEQKGLPSKWITLRALTMFAGYKGNLGHGRPATRIPVAQSGAHLLTGLS